MAPRKNKLARTLSGATAVAAALSMLATPVAAAELPHAKPVAVHDAGAGDAHGYGRGRHRRGNDIDAGDILTGVLILGGIAAIAGAVENDRDERYRYPEDAGYRRPEAQPRFESRGMDRAIDICVAEVEQRGQGRIGSVDSAARTGEGWHVAGALDDGASYACSIDNDGRVSDVEIGGYQASAESGFGAGADGQWSDEDYARAREAQDGAAAPYETAQAPDYE